MVRGTFSSIGICFNLCKWIYHIYDKNTDQLLFYEALVENINTLNSYYEYWHYLYSTYTYKY